MRPAPRLATPRLVAGLVAVACTSGTSSREPSSGGPSYPPPHFTPKKVDLNAAPAANWFQASCALPHKIFTRMRRGYYPGTSPEILFVPRTPDFFGGFVQTSHSGPWDYLAKVPLVFYGPGFIRPVGAYRADREVTLADVAPTLAKLLGTPPPNPTGPGRSLDRILVPESRRPSPPRLILTIVWDGGGMNVLNTWPDYWPNLNKLGQQGASITGANVGSSPSITPAIHTNIGTGTFPNRHGIFGITIRDAEGNFIDSFAGRDADAVKVPTLGDTYDLATGNRSKVGLFAYKSWHLGMTSHGADFPGGDRDLAAFLDTNEKFATNPDLYYMPRYLDDIPGFKRELQRIDLEDGVDDEKWMGHQVLDDPRYRRDTPVWILHQTDVIKALIKRESFGADAVPDLFFTNYKQPDEGGHDWNMLNPEMADIVKHTDGALPKLVRFLNSVVGKKQWVIAVTADHGQQPDAQLSNGWPISTSELVADVAARFDLDVGSDVFGSAGGLWLDEDVLASRGLSEATIANYLIRYRVEDNIPKSRSDEIPEEYADRYDEPVLSAAFPASSIGRVGACIGNNP